MTEKKKTGFWKGIRTEFKKISWPTKKEVWNSTLAVGVSVILISLIVWLIDQILLKGLGLFI